MIPFSAPLNDILWSLTHVAQADRLPDWYADEAAEILGHFAKFTESEIAPLDAIGDAEGCKLVDGRVQMPTGFGRAYQAYVEGGWHGAALPAEHGGMGLSALLSLSSTEILAGACHAFQMVVGLVPGAARTVLNFGTEDQIAATLPGFTSGEMLATMCLTEPGAGSDLSAIRTKAVETNDGWAITGEKIFISGGDQDMSPRIAHLVLARTGAVEDGIKGLSLFLCLSDQCDATQISVTRIEEKLGLHASPTCQLRFQNAPGHLIGAKGQGLTAMFTLMNHARLDVALQGVAHAARARAIAQDYCSTRIQGRKADQTPALLCDHADVQRMLGHQRLLEITARAMVHLTAVELELGERPLLVEFLTPLCKIYATEAGIQAADLGIQLLGGYGYLREYRVEQTWRDARITAIYEGTNGIHAATLAGRLLRWKDGAAADAFAAFLSTLGLPPAEFDTWNTLRQQVAQSEHFAPLAHGFSRATLALFERALWTRFTQLSGAIPTADIALAQAALYEPRFSLLR